MCLIFKDAAFALVTHFAALAASPAHPLDGKNWLQLHNGAAVQTIFGSNFVFLE